MKTSRWKPFSQPMAKTHVWWKLGLLSYLLQLTTAFQSCPSICVCKWKNGKRWVECQNQGQISIPDKIDIDTQVLDLSGNNLQILPREVFARHGLLNLQRLNLANCNIGQIDQTAFRGLTNLVELNLSGNLLTSVPIATFADIPYLRVLQLNRNPLQKVEANAFVMVPQLVNLDLSHCKIQKVAAKAFSMLSSLEKLFIDHNEITELRQKTVETIKGLHGIEMSHNPWVCDCRLRALKQWLTSENVPLSVEPVCAEPRRVEGRTFASLKVDEFACPPELLSVPRFVEAKSGDNVTIACKVGSVPAAIVRWFQFEGASEIRNNSESTVGSRTFHVYEQGSYEKVSNLTLTNARVEDSGVYTCVSQNPAGRVEANFTLQIGYFVGGVASLESSQIAGIVVAFGLMAVVLVVISAVFLIRHRSCRRVPSGSTTGGTASRFAKNSSPVTKFDCVAPTTTLPAAPAGDGGSGGGGGHLNGGCNGAASGYVVVHCGGDGGADIDLASTVVVTSNGTNTTLVNGVRHLRGSLGDDDDGEAPSTRPPPIPAGGRNSSLEPVHFRPWHPVDQQQQWRPLSSLASSDNGGANTVSTAGTNPDLIPSPRPERPPREDSHALRLLSSSSSASPSSVHRVSTLPRKAAATSMSPVTDVRKVINFNSSRLGPPPAGTSPPLPPSYSTSVINNGSLFGSGGNPYYSSPVVPNGRLGSDSLYPDNNDYNFRDNHQAGQTIRQYGGTLQHPRRTTAVVGPLLLSPNLVRKPTTTISGGTKDNDDDDDDFFYDRYLIRNTGTTPPPAGPAQHLMVDGGHQWRQRQRRRLPQLDPPQGPSSRVGLEGHGRHVVVVEEDRTVASSSSSPYLQLRSVEQGRPRGSSPYGSPDLGKNNSGRSSLSCHTLPRHHLLITPQPTSSSSSTSAGSRHNHPNNSSLLPRRSPVYANLQSVSQMARDLLYPADYGLPLAPLAEALNEAAFEAPPDISGPTGDVVIVDQEEDHCRFGSRQIGSYGHTTVTSVATATATAATTATTAAMASSDLCCDLSTTTSGTSSSFVDYDQGDGGPLAALGTATTSRRLIGQPQVMSSSSSSMPASASQHQLHQPPPPPTVPKLGHTNGFIPIGAETRTSPDEGIQDDVSTDV